MTKNQPSLPLRRGTTAILVAVAVLLAFSSARSAAAGNFGAAMAFEDLSRWEGLVADYENPKEGLSSGRWENTLVNTRLRYKGFPKDITRYNGMSFWVYSEKANGACIAMALFSDNAATEESDYYLYRVTIAWDGWSKIVVPFKALTPVREPIGLNQIDYLRFASESYGCGEAKADTLLKFDDMQLVNIDENGNVVEQIEAIDWRPFDGLAMQTIMEQYGSALIYVRSSKFPLCQEFEQTYLLSRDMQQLLAGRTVFFVDVVDHPIIAQQFEILKVPAFLLTRPNQKSVVYYVTNLSDPGPLVAFLKSLPPPRRPQ